MNSQEKKKNMAENVLFKKGEGNTVGILVWKTNPKSKLDKYFGFF